MTDSAAAGTGDLIVSTVSTGEMPAEADHTPVEQPPAPSPVTEKDPEPANESPSNEIPSVETGSSREEPPRNVPSDTENAPAEPAEDRTAEGTDSSQEEPPQDVPSDAENAPAEPAEDRPAEGTDSSQEEPPRDVPSDTEEDPAEPAEDILAGEMVDSREEQPQDASPDTGEDPETREEEASGEPGEAREDNESWDGTLEVDVVCKIQLRDVRLYRLTLPGRMDLILTADGDPVKVTVVSLQSGQKRVRESAAVEHDVYMIHEALTLEKGEYSVTVEPLRENQQGTVSICFATPEPETDVLIDTAAEPDTAETPDTDTAPDADASEPQSGSTGAEAGGETIPAAETDEVPEKVIPGDDAAEDPDEDPLPDPAEELLNAAAATEDDPGCEPVTEENPLPDAGPDGSDGADCDGPAAEPLTVRIMVSCEEGFRPGSRIVLTAVVSNPDYEGAIHWQYSADGGATVCDVEDADGREYSFVLDEANSTYLWRAYLE